ncbi:type VI secretion system baseplate subunit TssF [Telluria aromaticivorans]|uniref:Type VI secretion system baseplate subunit TssF n=1 Tax=Telluria aromaticivorans TaxID=2725995 RepID=A0A7Y2K1Q3_9BURK|nr:type VI secretion system baseplate subunit TssF [Telluria aromaticivorans]NNG24513.1 type VI secretion system baseplate subunit TssF [Telluria aromaticivorans]
MEELLPYYERELVYLNTVGRELASQYPRLASELGMGADGSEDPHIRRLIQACALLNARTSKKLDDDYPEFTEALLGSLYPYFLQGIPSCSIARVGMEPGPHAPGKGEGVQAVPRGTEMSALHGKGTACRFRTASPVTLAPLSVAGARYEPVVHAPANLRLPARASGQVTLTIESAAPVRLLHQQGMPRLRLYLDADPLLAAALLDTLFMRVGASYLETGDPGSWRPLERVPLALGGFGDDDALVPLRQSEHGAYRLLSEYFAFPEKFHFIDIDLGKLAPLLPPVAHRFTLHLIVNGLHGDTGAARLLGSLGAQHLVPGCAPVVNLFHQAAMPVRITHRTAMYDVVPGRHEEYVEVYSIDAVTVLRTVESRVQLLEYRPYYGLRHGEGGELRERYWFARRDDRGLHRQRMKIGFTDAGFSLTADEQCVASIDLTCTNGAHATTVGVGAPGGDLMSETATSGLPIHLLRKPTPPHRFPSSGGAHWRLVAQLALNHRSLGDLDALREVLTLYDVSRSAATQRQIAGITELQTLPSTAWIRNKIGATLVHGLEVRMTVDEEAFAGASLVVFAEVVNRFFGLYVHINSFTRLVVRSSQSDRELLRCDPRNGSLTLV